MKSTVFKNVGKALVLCAHTDDEFGCAGTVLRLAESGVYIKYLALSRCEDSLPKGYKPDTLEKECMECTKTLGIKREDVDIQNYRVRHFPEKRQSILEYLFKLNQSFQPNLVLLPASYDNHQDHAVVFQEGLRAFKHSTLLGYELPQNVTSFENSAFVHLEEEHMEKKIHAMSSYKSQSFRPYSDPEYLRSLARVRGVQCGTRYAEAFEAIRLILR